MPTKQQRQNKDRKADGYSTLYEAAGVLIQTILYSNILDNFIT